MTEYDYKDMMPGTQDSVYRVDQYIVWGAGRAAACAMAGKFSGLAIIGNAAYMITRIAQVHEVELSKAAATGFAGGLVTALATAAVSLLVPVRAVRVPAAVGMTYAIGKAANMWIADGMPADISRYKPMLQDWFNQGKELAASLAAQGYENLPQEGKDLWDGIENEAGYYAEKARFQYNENKEKVQAAKDKWDRETKYQVHDQAAEVVEQAKETVSSAANRAQEVANTAATAATLKATETYAAAKDKAMTTKEALQTKAADTKEALQTRVSDVKASVQDTVATVQASAGLAKETVVGKAADVKEKVANKLGK